MSTPNEIAERELRALGDFIDALRSPGAKYEREHLRAMLDDDLEPVGGCGVCYSLRRLLARASGNAVASGVRGGVENPR